MRGGEIMGHLGLSHRPIFLYGYLQSIEMFREYRTALIPAAVTGKIDVGTM